MINWKRFTGVPRRARHRQDGWGPRTWWCRLFGQAPPCSWCHGGPLLGNNPRNDLERVQDHVSCPAGQACLMANITSDCNIYVCYTCLAQTLHVRMAKATQRTVVSWTIKFPNLPTCHRRRREWYDTLLGGTGTVLGVSNTIDGEVTRTVLSTTGQYTSRALHQVGEWLPNGIGTQLSNVNLWTHQYNWQLTMFNETYRSLMNLTQIANWTACNMQMLHARIQKERFITGVYTGNYHQWRNTWNISQKLWLQLFPEQTVCNNTQCKGYWYQYNVTQVKTVCRYEVLPVISIHGYHYLHVSGEWFKAATNTTYDTDLCDKTDQGMVCTLQMGHANLCLSDSQVTLCDWSVETPRDMLWQVGPQYLCVATMRQHPQLPSAPFVGCLNDVHLWHWNNQTYYLTNYSQESRLSAVQWEVLRHPWTVSLDRFKCALDRSTELKDLIQRHRYNVTRLWVSTLIAGDEVKHVARLVQQSSAHHWWDILSGMSVTARKTILPPLFILAGCLIILTLCNVFTCLYVRRAKRQLERIIFNQR
ncbi:uncharacterized protein LOC129178227 [Dunckerocampus dactyliophorus]|uniref:uncharacterized protein LOC129178227 n=1 Tax=Dunckerocampus dactyliophorus TaxID=161453 RepID=UPI0024075D7F|nr:uncharacterized protein LOC129178227 [Dunckerocampus dactyliophorus]